MLTGRNTKFSGGVKTTFGVRKRRETKNQNKTTNSIMNKLEIKGDWHIAKGKLKQKWAKLTDNDLQFVAGKEEELIGRIQKCTGEAREIVERALHESCGCSTEKKQAAEKSTAGTARVH